jgi:formylmethanofuran dehydrogenase subunit B
MTDPEPARAESPGAWTCPFCPLLCDGFSVDASAAPMRLVGSDCARARAALSRFDPAPGASSGPGAFAPEIDAAVSAAARLLAASRQPLFAGLGTDVAGARALYRLACETGAICDAAQGDALMQSLRALQDRGGYTTTLAEVRGRADLVVCIGGVPSARLPEFFARCGIDGPGTTPASASVVVLADDDADVDAWAALADALGPRAQRQALHGDFFITVALLAAALDDRAAPAALATLAKRLQAARYAVIVHEPAQLPSQAGLLIETLDRLVAALNRTTRAATLALGGGDGAATANQVFAWLSGLPLRSRAGPSGLEHEPLRFASERLLAEGTVDALLWVSSFEGASPPPTELPQIVLAPPGTAGAKGSIFIPVSTPGIGSAGHLFRTDGAVLLPLQPLRDDGLPSVAAVVARITQALRGLRGLP